MDISFIIFLGKELCIRREGTALFPFVIVKGRLKDVLTGSFFVYRMQMKHIIEPLFVSHCILVQYCFLSFVSIILRHLCPVHRMYFRYVVTQNITLSRCLASRVNANRHLVKGPLYLALAEVVPLPKYIYFMAKLNK